MSSEDRANAEHDSRENYEGATESLSTIARSLGFAAIAIVWLFSAKTKEGNVTVPHDLTRAAIGAVFALSFDFSQYVYKSVAWGVVHSAVERGKLNIDRDGGPFPPWVNWPTIALFWLKVLAIAVTYLLLGVALWSRLS